MNNITLFLQNLRSQGGLKGKLKNKLFAAVMQGFEAANADMENNEGRLAALEKRNAELEQHNANIEARIDVLLKRLDDFQNDVAELSRRIDDSNGTTAALRSDFESVCVNVRTTNADIERLCSDIELIKLKQSRIDRKPERAVVGTAVNSGDSGSASAVTDEPSSDYDCIDYFDFENHFRGSIESVKKAQEIYLPYFADKKNVVDIGCGRGEFLSLMKDNGVNACGVDIYEPYVDYCRMKGLNAVCGDGGAYLAQCSDVDGIFMGQVAEHLRIDRIMSICNTAYEKLTEGGCIVIETPNPTSLAIYTNAFYIDPSHVKPVHPMTLRYCLEKAGFKNIEVIFTENSRPPFGIPKLEAENAEEFNEAMSRVSELLYGSQDYAVIAVK